MEILWPLRASHWLVPLNVLTTTSRLARMRVSFLDDEISDRLDQLDDQYRPEGGGGGGGSSLLPPVMLMLPWRPRISRWTNDPFASVHCMEDCLTSCIQNLVTVAPPAKPPAVLNTYAGTRSCYRPAGRLEPAFGC